MLSWHLWVTNEVADKELILLKNSARERVLAALMLGCRRLVRATARRTALWRLYGRSVHAVASEVAH